MGIPCRLIEHNALDYVISDIGLSVVLYTLIPVGVSGGSRGRKAWLEGCCSFDSEPGVHRQPPNRIKLGRGRFGQTVLLQYNTIYHCNIQYNIV